jgi:hypothetical protein
MLAEGDTAVMDDVRHSPDFTDRSAVRWHVEMYWRFYRTYMPEMIALRQAAMASPEFGRRLQEILAADQKHMYEHLDHVRRAGIPLPGDPRLVISAIHSLFDQFAYTWLVAGGDGSGPLVSDEEAIETLTDFVYRGVAGTPPRTADE